MVRAGGTPTVPLSPHQGEPKPTPDEEIAPHNEDEPNGRQDEASPVAVVLVPHEADATDGVTIHLVEMGTGGSVGCGHPSLHTSAWQGTARTWDHGPITCATARMATVRTKGMDQVMRWK